MVVTKSRSRLVLFLLLGMALIAGLLFSRWVLHARDLRSTMVPTRTLRILTYSSFVGSTGPGPELIQQFKRDCSCEVEISTAGDGGLLIERLLLARKSTPFDVVIGLDQLSAKKALQQLAWKEIKLDSEFVDPISRFDSHFVPYDWSPLAFIYREREIEPPTSLKDLTEARFKEQIALQDPRSSTPGLELYGWIEQSEGSQAQDFWRALKPNVASVSPSWSYSYGLFKKGRAKLVFSYLTSLLYHWREESDRRYHAAIFEGGHPYQVESAGVPENCGQCELAEKFVRTLVQPGFQALIAKRNFMLPVLKTLAADPSYADLPHLKLIELNQPDDLSDWSAVFGK